MSKTCPDGHPAEHVEVIVPLVPGRPMRIVHQCSGPHALGEPSNIPGRVAHHWVGSIEGYVLQWAETVRHVGAVAHKVSEALEALSDS